MVERQHDTLDVAGSTPAPPKRGNEMKNSRRKKKHYSAKGRFNIYKFVDILEELILQGKIKIILEKEGE